MRLRLIGQMEAWTLNSQSILPTGRKTRAVLAVLALSASRPVLRGRLAELLWSRRPDDQARASLRQEIHRLADALGAAGSHALVVTRDHMALRPGATWVDVEEVLRATTAKPAALSLLDGELLEDLDGVDVAFDAWLAGERERLRDRARALAETLLREQTEPDAAIVAAQRLLAIDRAHEGAWRALMRSYAARGERGMAIQAYERCRAALADLLDTQPSEETTRLIAEIRAGGASRPGDARPGPPVDPRGARRGQTTLEKPAEPRGPVRVGVMALTMVGMTEEEAPLGASLAEEITSALARFGWMSLVSSNSLVRFAGEARNEAAIRDVFGVNYLLDGTVLRAQRRLRVSLRLLDLLTGNQVVWSRRFDRLTDDLLALQDDISAEAAAQIEPEILLRESRRAAAGPPDSATTYDLLLRAIGMIDRLERPVFLQAGDLLRQATERERDCSAAHAWYAWWHVMLVSQDWGKDPAAAAVQAGLLAERAITLDPRDAKALAIAGHVRAYLQRRSPEAATLHERALALNPNLAMAWGLSAITFAYMGDFDECERRMQRYKKLSPLDPRSFFYDSGLCVVALLRQDHSAAVSIGRGVSEMNPAFSGACKPYLAALGHLGLADEAARVRARLLAIEPRFTLRRFLRGCPFEVSEHREHYIDGLRRAGVPD